MNFSLHSGGEFLAFLDVYLFPSTPALFYFECESVAATWHLKPSRKLSIAAAGRLREAGMKPSGWISQLTIKHHGVPQAKVYSSALLSSKERTKFV